MHMSKDFKYTLNGKDIELPKEGEFKDLELTIVFNEPGEEFTNNVIETIRKHFKHGKETI